jgi:hypothetical protein
VEPFLGRNGEIFYTGRNRQLIKRRFRSLFKIKSFNITHHIFLFYSSYAELQCEKQKQRLKILEPQFRKAIEQLNLASAKTIIHDLQDVLRPSGHMIKLIQHKNKLYELAIEKGEFEVALAGLKSHREILSDNTRLYVESTALLAICYLRMQMIEKAKPFIKEVLLNDKVIKTEQKRKIFRSAIIERFNEEVVLCTLIGGKMEQFTEAELEHEVVKIVVEHNEQGAFEMIGKLTHKQQKKCYL